MKYPAMMWYTGDWLKDPAVTVCSPATRGIWFDLLNVIFEARQGGRISGTADQLARLARCDVPSLLNALEEVMKNGVGIVTPETLRVTLKNFEITVKCRRMEREFNKLQRNALRQKKFRDNARSNAPITTIESGTGTSSSIGKGVQGGRDVVSDFNRFWSAYPRKYARFDAEHAWVEVNASDHMESIIQALEIQKASEDWKREDGRFIPKPSNWLRDGRWHDVQPERNGKAVSLGMVHQPSLEDMHRMDAEKAARYAP